MKTQKHRLPNHAVPERYRLVVHPDLEAGTFKGEETIFLKLTAPSKSITLHSRDLKLSGVTLIDRAGKGSGTHYRPTKTTFDKAAETVTFLFAKPLPQGKGELLLNFAGKLATNMRGFYRSTYEHGGTKKYLATTQFEPTDARGGFPCFDEPEAKAIFDITVIAKKEHQIVSNTCELPAVDHYADSGLKVVSFESTPRMSTYLVAFIVGDLEFIETKSKGGVVVRAFATKGKSEQARFALTVAARSLDVYEKFFGTPYPLPVLDLIAIPDFQSAAMENWGAITYRESALLLEQDKSTLAQQQWVAIVTCHEVAHQWFGNLVTMQWWTDLWLNEGFASYMEYWCTDQLFPQWNLWEQFTSGRFDSALDLDMLAGTHAVEIPVGHPREIDEIFDTISYAKGSSIVRMLADWVGPKAFQSALSSYMKKHAFKNTVTDDLWAAFEKASGKPVKKMMTTWTRTEGYPLVSGTRNKNKLTLSQQRFFLTSKKSTATWPVPVSVTFGPKPKTTTLLLGPKAVTVPVPSGSSYYKINAGEVGFYRTGYAPEDLAALSHWSVLKKLQPADRLGLVRDLYTLAERGDVPLSQALAFTEELKGDTSLPVWINLLQSLSLVRRLSHGTIAEQPLKDFILHLTKDQLSRLGLAYKKGEPHDDQLLRSSVTATRIACGDQQVLKTALGWYKDLSAGKKVHAEHHQPAYQAASKTATSKTFSALVAQYKKGSPEDTERIARSFGSLPTTGLLTAALDFAFSKDVRAQDGWIIILMVWSSPLAESLTWDYLQKHWKLVSERFGHSSHTLGRIISGLKNVTTESTRKRAETFIRSKKLLGTARTLSQGLELSVSAARFKKHILSAYPESKPITKPRKA